MATGKKNSLEELNHCLIWNHQNQQLEMVFQDGKLVGGSNYCKLRWLVISILNDSSRRSVQCPSCTSDRIPLRTRGLWTWDPSRPKGASQCKE